MHTNQLDCSSQVTSIIFGSMSLYSIVVYLVSLGWFHRGNPLISLSSQTISHPSVRSLMSRPHPPGEEKDLVTYDVLPNSVTAVWHVK